MKKFRRWWNNLVIRYQENQATRKQVKILRGLADQVGKHGVLVQRCEVRISHDYDSRCMNTMGGPPIMVRGAQRARYTLTIEWGDTTGENEEMLKLLH